jgi:hypothetical protein
MFLEGLGGASLAIPFLPSLLPRQARAQQARGPTRFAMVYTKYGNHYRSWWTNTAPTTAAPDDSYRWRTLSDIDGELSPILGAPFSGPIRRKLAVVRGLDPYCKPSAHNSSFATTANVGWGTDGPNAHTLREKHFAYSLDAVLEESPRFYPTRPALGAVRTAGNTRFSYGMESWSWTHRTGVIQRLGHDWNPKVVYDKVFNVAAQNDPKAAARLTRLKDVTGLVHEDFKRTLANRRISAGDRVRLDNFMSLLAQARARLDAPVVSCARGGDVEARLGQLDDFNKINSVLFDIEVAALACGTTKIVMHGLASYGPSFPEESDLKWHEICHANDARALAASKWHAEKFAELVKKLDAVTEADGNTLLDNTVVIYANEDCTGGHFLMDMPIVVAGGKGKIKTDLYIDYRNLSDRVTSTPFGDSSGAWRSFFYGRPYNNLLITALRALGLTESDYKKYPDQDGYGGYTGGHGAGHYTKFVSTSSERNAPLPGLWAGG